jgi:lysine 2,3-aminomutase
MPMRVNAKLLIMLKKYSPIWMNTHFNHPKEITELSKKACLDIVNSGIPLGNQNVLLKGVNDDPQVLKELYMKLLAMKVRPYYMYQCDLAYGLNHFRTDIGRGLEIMDELTGQISGLAVPKFVVDAPDGGGKIPISHDYIVEKRQGEYSLKNYKGEIYTYPVIE